MGACFTFQDLYTVRGKPSTEHTGCGLLGVGVRATLLQPKWLSSCFSRCCGFLYLNNIRNRPSWFVTSNSWFGSTFQEMGSLLKWKTFFLCVHSGRLKYRANTWMYLNCYSFWAKRIASNVILTVIHSFTPKRAAYMCSRRALIYCDRHMQAPLWCYPFMIVKAFPWWLALHQDTHIYTHSLFELP